ncbi:MAG: RluA family pseudouridine synthase, partial [Candidatus Portiera sp.]|nr:RluA family pseudouridine synthase [Portiera sp.]
MSGSLTFIVSLSVRDLRVSDIKQQRVDSFLAECFPDVSRSTIQDWIKGGQVKVNDEKVKPSSSVHGKEHISISATLVQAIHDLPQESELAVVYEDDDMLIINKPVGLVVHPGAGNPDNTLLNYLLAYRSEQKDLPRAGLVHRLDRGTSGLLLVSKNLQSHNILQEMIKNREVKRDYLALVEGVPISGGKIDAPIGRDPRNRLRMLTYSRGAVPARARSAVTHFRVKEKFVTHALLDVALETGRTHQIRTHMQSVGFPIIGDGFYGWHKKLPPNIDDELRDYIRGFSHPALHAVALAFTYKSGGNEREINLKAEPPADMLKMVKLLRKNNE